MGELAYVLLVFWLLWAVDGVKFAAAGLFNVIGVGRWARVIAATWHGPHPWPGGWRTTCPDIPFSISPAGICNRAAGAAGRELDKVITARAWRWDELKEARAEKGWVWVNGARFYRDTGHITAGGLLALAKMAPEARARRIESWIARMVRPVHLERRRRVLLAKTQTVAVLNVVFFGLAVVVTGYLTSEVSARLPKRWADAVGEALPIYGVGLLGLHLLALGCAAWSVKRLKAARVDNRGTALFSAAMLPPQAMRLRAIVGEAWFPLQHPVAYALAFGKTEARNDVVFHALADGRWPLGCEQDVSLAREITAWYRACLMRRITEQAKASGLDVESLFAPPVADGPASVSYCPRCRSQFVTGPTHCGDGVKLEPLPKR